MFTLKVNPLPLSIVKKERKVVPKRFSSHNSQFALELKHFTTVVSSPGRVKLS
jgi:hypothetical protein